MELELPVFKAYRGTGPPRFASPAELECAKVLDYYDVAWEYEPRTFVLEQDEKGRVTEAFTPDFFLPEQDLYVEITAMKQSLVTPRTGSCASCASGTPTSGSSSSTGATWSASPSISISTSPA